MFTCVVYQFSHKSSAYKAMTLANGKVFFGSILKVSKLFEEESEGLKITNGVSSSSKHFFLILF